MKYRFKLIVPLTYYDETIESEEVELSEQDVMLIRSLVKQSRNRRRGLMPILEEGAPELYDRLWEAIEEPLCEVVIKNGRENGYFDPDEDERSQIDWDCVDYVCQIPKFAKS